MHRWPKLYRPVLLLVACAVAWCGPIPLAGNWNDAGRLATVQCLVDYHTWQIDQSDFLPGTLDKALINGHFYSDKSPAVSLAMAAVYKALQVTTGLKVVNNPALFCQLMALIFSGIPYVIAVFCVDWLIVFHGLSTGRRFWIDASFVFGTMAAAYTREVNNHILMLAVFALLFRVVAKCAQPGWERFSFGQLLAIGSLIGIGYSIDLGVGPVLVLGTAGFLFYRTRSIKGVVIALAAAFPWFALHHGLNYMISGTFRPVGAIPEYFMWPGSPLTGRELTGVGWDHDSFVEFLAYSIKLLIGPRGFIVHNLMLFLAVPFAVVVWRDKVKKFGLAGFCAGLILGIWLLYAATSDNYAGRCCSIRWFLPLLIPFYYILIIFLKTHPFDLIKLAMVSLWSMALGVLLWGYGPWWEPNETMLWCLNAGALISWLAYGLYRMSAKPTVA